MKNLQSFYDVLFGNFVVIILIASGITLFSMFDNLQVTVKEMSTGMIRDRLNLTEEELFNIFDPIVNHLQTTRSRARSGVLKNFQDPELLDAYFLPIIKNSSSISSVLIANDQGDEYMLLNNDSIMITRITKEGSLHERPTVYSWTESNGERLILDQHVLEEDYDPRTRPWFTLAMENPADTVISWTDPYTFFTTRQSGITASVSWQNPKSSLDFVCAVDVLITDLSSFTTSIDITTNGKVFILSEDLQVLGLPRDERFKDKSKWAEFSLKSLNQLEVPVINEAIKTYQSQGERKNFIPFSFENEVWWSGIDQFPLNATKSLIVGVIVPETDFAKDIEDTRHLLMGGLILTLFFFLIILYAFLKMKRANKIIAIERDKNEQLLLNTLPIKVVNDLKENGKSVPQKFKDVTVCFADIVGFTQISSQLDPKQLINELNDIYTTFDEIMIKYDCERIKTMGDAYLSVCGMPQQNNDHAEMMLRAAFEILAYIEKRTKNSKIDWKMRIGMHSGSVVGGIVGIKKYIYDVFGDTINTASRMERYSEPMHVNLSEETYNRVKDSICVQDMKIRFEKRKPAMVKGKGLMNMYFAHISA